MLFTRLSPSSFINSSISTLNGMPIDRISNYKYLGIWIDDKLSFKIHISELTKKLKSELSLFYLNRACFTFKCRKQLVQATFLPVLDYADIINMHAALTTLKPLDAVYHSALRFRLNKNINTTLLFLLPFFMS